MNNLPQGGLAYGLADLLKYPAKEILWVIVNSPS
jgi:hypothetical protein